MCEKCDFCVTQIKTVHCVGLIIVWIIGGDAKYVDCFVRAVLFG